MGGFSLWHWLIVIAIVALLFGGKGKISGLQYGRCRQHRRRPPGARPRLRPRRRFPRCMPSMPLRRHARPLRRASMSLRCDKTWMAVTSTAKGGAQGRDAAYSPLRERIGMILADAGGAVAAAPRRSAPCTAAASASRLNGFLSTGSAPVCASNIEVSA